MEMKATFIVKSRYYFSLQHIQTAALFARQSAQIEKNYNGHISADLITDHWAYVTGTIFAAVSFLEATINEFFADAVDNPYSALVDHLDDATRKLIANLWEQDTLRTSRLINKFQIALTLARKDLLDTGGAAFYDVGTLILIRNDLVHFKPVWTSVETKETEKSRKRILSLQQEKKFAFSPFRTAESDVFYPDKCLSYGCAKWAVDSSIQFAEDFYSKMGIPIFFEHVRTRLKTDI